jgi:hypothetical protein
MRGIFALDPGGHSGIAWGIFDPRSTVEEALQNGLHKGSATTEGEERGQIREITRLWMEFYRLCVITCCMDPDSVEFVCEDFIQRPGSKGGKEGQSPIRIMWGVEGYRMGRYDEFAGRKRGRPYAPQMILQHPSEMTGFATGKRLKKWGIWIVGKEHERSAFGHIAVRLARIRKNLRS